MYIQRTIEVYKEELFEYRRFYKVTIDARDIAIKELEDEITALVSFIALAVLVFATGATFTYFCIFHSQINNLLAHATSCILFWGGL